jgi:hypothetical protein
VLQLVNYKEILAVIIVACIAYFWKGHSARGSDLSQRQNWTVAHVAILITLLDLAVASVYFLPYVLGGSAFLPYAITSYIGLAVGLDILGLACFFSRIMRVRSCNQTFLGAWGACFHRVCFALG